MSDRNVAEGRHVTDSMLACLGCWEMIGSSSTHLRGRACRVHSGGLQWKTWWRLEETADKIADCSADYVGKGLVNICGDEKVVFRRLFIHDWRSGPVAAQRLKRGLCK